MKLIIKPNGRLENHNLGLMPPIVRKAISIAAAKAADQNKTMLVIPNYGMNSSWTYFPKNRKCFNKFHIKKGKFVGYTVTPTAIIKFCRFTLLSGKGA